MSTNEKDALDKMLAPPKGCGGRLLFLLIGVGLLLFFVFSFLIRYPDRLKAQGEIELAGGSVDIINIEDRVLSQILVPSQENVQAGDWLATWQGSGDPNLVIAWKNWLTNFQKNTQSSTPLPIPHPMLALETADIRRYVQLIKNQDPNRYLQAENATLQQQQADIKAMSQALQTEKKTLQKEIQLAQKAWLRDSALAANGHIPKMKAEESQKEWLQLNRETERIEAKLAENQWSSAQIAQTAVRTKKDFSFDRSTQETTLQGLVEALPGKIAAWEFSFVVKAPKSGLLRWKEMAKAGRNIPSNKAFLSISSDSAQDSIFVKGWLPIAGAGKALKGQTCRLMMEDFPKAEFGYLKGHLMTKGQQSEESPSGQMAYPIRIYVPVAETHSKKALSLQDKMTCTIEIETAKRSLWQRLMGK